MMWAIYHTYSFNWKNLQNLRVNKCRMNLKQVRVDGFNAVPHSQRDLTVETFEHLCTMCFSGISNKKKQHLQFIFLNTFGEL